MRAGFLASGVFVVLLLSQAGAAQAPAIPAGQTPTIRTTAGEVLLDLVVRDKHHRFVSDLHPNEIAIYEDGVRQDVKTFHLVSGANQLQAERGELEVNSKENGTGQPAPTPNRLRQLNFVSIVFGPTAPLNREFAREAVIDFLKSDSLPNTYVTVYGLGSRLSLIQPYTEDKEVLSAAVTRVSNGLSAPNGADASTRIASSAIATSLAQTAASASATQPPSGNPDPMMGSFAGAIGTSPLWARNAAAQDASSLPLSAALETQALLSTSLRFDSSEGMSTMDALRELVRNQATLPGRKVVLYLSDGLAFPVGRREVVDNLISLANRSGVTFYTVDTRGLSSEDPTLPGLASMEMSRNESRQRGPVTAQNPVHGHQEMDDVELTSVSNRQQSMQELAESTGGFAIANTNQIAEPMQRVMEDIRSHYQLSYAPKATTYDGHFRKIEVKLARSGLTVQTRKGYYALPMLNGEPLQPFEAAALDAIRAHPVPADLPYDAALMKFRSSANLVQYMMGFQIPVSELKPAPAAKGDKSVVRVAVVAIVHDAQGEVVGKISRELQRDLSPRDSANVATDHISYIEPLALPHGNYTIDTVVTDEHSGKASVRRISVPLDSGTGLGLSSLEIVRKAESLSGPRNPLNPFELDNTRIVPELDDAIASGGPITLYFVLYPAKLDNPVPTQATLELLRDGNEIGRQALKLPEARADGSIPVLLRVAPGPGSYAIVVTAKQGTFMAEAVRSLELK
jgi:VWFA-related protein